MCVCGSGGCYTKNFHVNLKPYTFRLLPYLRPRFRISLERLFDEDHILVQLLMPVGFLLSTRWYLKNDGPIYGPIDEYINVPLPIVYIP